MNQNHKKSCCICFTTEKVHKFPQGKGQEATEKFAVWANFAALENVLSEQKCYALCEKHFEKRMFMNSFSPRLVKPAFPTLHPPVYHGPTTMDGSPVCPSIPKSETFDSICKWKEAVVLNPNLLQDPAFCRFPFCNKEKNQDKPEEQTPPPDAIITVTCSFLNPVEDVINGMMNQTNKRPASPDSSEMETIRVLPVRKTYSRRNSLNKQKSDNSLLKPVADKTPPPVIEPSYCEDRMAEISEMRTADMSEMRTAEISEMRTSSSLIDNWNSKVLNDSTVMNNTDSPLLSSVDRLPSPVMELNTSDYVSLSVITDSPDESYSLADKDIESSFSSMISSFNIDTRIETDLLYEAMINADICFNEDSSLYSDVLKTRKVAQNINV